MAQSTQDNLVISAPPHSWIGKTFCLPWMQQLQLVKLNNSPTTFPT